MSSPEDAAAETGRIAGQAVAWIALLAGVVKCWSISRRKTTNTKCALSLMMVLLAVLFSSTVTAVFRELGPSPARTAGQVLVGLAMMGCLGVAIVLAILGLIELAAKPSLYAQGKAQAIWTLVLAGVMVLAIGVGAVAGATRALAHGGQSQPGKMLTFEELNFRFQSPDRPWMAYDASKFNKDSRVSFMRQWPEAYFFIIAEKLGPRIDFNSAKLAEAGIARLKSVASARVLSQAPLRVGGLEGVVVEAEAQLSGLTLHYRNWYCSTNGFAYQLVGYCRSENQAEEMGDLAAMLGRFQLLDPNRVAEASGGFSTNFYAPDHGYRVVLTNSAWHDFPALESSCPLAEFGCSQGDSCLTVVSADWVGRNPSQDALTAAFLATLGIIYPNENLTDWKTLSEAGLSGEQFDYAREVEGRTVHYRFKILQGAGKGYLVAAWTQRRAADVAAVLSDAVTRVQFSGGDASSPLPSVASAVARPGKTQGFILNQVGLYYNKQGDYDQAVPLFCAAAHANPQESIYAVNALESWTHLDRPTEALAFLDSLPASVLGLPQIRADQAFYQARALLIDEALTNYAGVFAGGYRSDEQLTEYVGLLAQQKRYDDALAVVSAYLQNGESVPARQLEAQMHRQKHELPKAISLLQELRRKAPFNHQVAEALAETYLGAGQYTEALELSRAMVKDDDNSVMARYLQGRSELGLKWYREAKISFAEAAKLAPANKDIRSYLDYVSGLLGEGENTAIMEAIAPVPLPALLTNALETVAPPGYATNYGAYYLRRVVAVEYAPGREYKTTELMVAQMLDAAGVSGFSTVQVSYDPLAEQIYVNEVRVMDGGGRTISTGNAANYYVLDDGAAMGASQHKVLNIPVPGLQPGCRLAVTITRRELGRLDEFPFLAHTFAGTVPALESDFFLAGDARGLNYQTAPRREPRELPEGLCWQVSDPLVARWEPLQPPAATFLPMLWIADAATQWPQAVSNYLAAISDRLVPDPEVQNEARRLVGALDKDEVKVAALTSYVQTNLTYKAIEFGRRARRPNQPADILHNKYGDCKDHALLLQQMLAAVGVPAQLALASLHNPVQTNLPSLDQFDHMIVFVPGPRPGFLDCTSKGADVARAIPAGLAGSQVLILDGRNPRFATVPADPENASTIAVEQHLRWPNETEAAVDESLTLTGVPAAAMRGYLLATPESSRRNSLQTAMGLSDIDLTGFEVHSLEARSEPLRLRFVYGLKRQLRRSEHRLTVNLVSGSAGSYLSAGPVDNRLTPFEINFPLSLESKVLIDAPPGFAAEPPGKLDAKLDARFLTGAGTGEVQNGQVKLEFKCRQYPGKFAAADYSAYRQTMAQALSFLEREVVFKATAP